MNKRSVESKNQPLKAQQALSVLRAHQREFERFRVKSLSIFGSVARNEAGPLSDLDLLVEFDGAATYDLYMGLKFYLEGLLGCRVDLVMDKALKQRMRPAVERDAVRVA